MFISESAPTLRFSGAPIQRTKEARTGESASASAYTMAVYDESCILQIELAAFIINHRRLTHQNVCAKYTVAKLFALPLDYHIDV
jgi:hypothetical protein